VPIPTRNRRRPRPRTRVERDTLGEVEVPVNALWGAQTARALRNFPISGLREPASLVEAVVLVKIAAARVNARLGLLPRRPVDRPQIPHVDDRGAVRVGAAGKQQRAHPVDLEARGRVAGDAQVADQR